MKKPRKSSEKFEWNPEIRTLENKWSDEIYTFNDADMDLCLYPNPSSGKAYIEFTDVPDKAQITVRDILGRTILKRVVLGGKVEEFDLSNFRTQQILLVTI